MAMRNQRAEARVAVSEQAEFMPDGVWMPCTVLNMSSHGFLLNCKRAVTVGQQIDFRCELYPGKRLECKVEIRHVGPTGNGAKIIGMDDRGKRLCQVFLEEQYSNQVGRTH